MGLKHCFCKCCDYVCNICLVCFNYVLSLSIVAIGSCIFGMIVASLFFIFYYSTLYPSTPSASLEHTGMYDYFNEDPIVKREISDETVDVDHFDTQYYDPDVGSDYISRNRRNLSAPETVTTISFPLSTPNSKQSNPSSDAPMLHDASTATSDWENNVFVMTSKSKTDKSNFLFRHQTTSTTTTEEPIEYDPDFHLANVVMDSIYAYSENAEFKTPLGLCRKSADIKVPELNATLFPAEQASDILTCINNLWLNQGKKQLCIHLDGEMNAYLKWLILTGEPKEKHKPNNIGTQEDTFLFPPSECGKEPPQQPSCLVDHGFQKHLEQ